MTMLWLVQTKESKVQTVLIFLLRQESDSVVFRQIISQVDSIANDINDNGVIVGGETDIYNTSTRRRKALCTL